MKSFELTTKGKVSYIHETLSGEQVSHIEFSNLSELISIVSPENIEKERVKRNATKTVVDAISFCSSTPAGTLSNEIIVMDDMIFACAYAAGF